MFTRERESAAPTYLGRSRWPLIALSRGYEVRLGKMLQPGPASPADRLVPFLKAGHVQWKGVSTGDLPTMYASAQEAEQYAVRQGDLLVCEGGEVGRSVILGTDIPEGTIIQNSLHRVRPRLGYSAQYLLYVLSAIHSSGWLEVLCNRATIAHLTADKLAALRIPAPPLSEQGTIADFLDRETKRIDVLTVKLGHEGTRLSPAKTLLSLLLEKRQALITAAVIGRVEIASKSFN